MRTTRLLIVSDSILCLRGSLHPLDANALHPKADLLPLKADPFPSKGRPLPWTDRHISKHYLPSTSFAGGNKKMNIYVDFET